MIAASPSPMPQWRNGRTPRLRIADPLDVRHVPPHDAAAEAAVLGAMAVGRDDDRILAEHLYVSAHQTIHRAIVEMRGEGVLVDGVTLAHELERRGEMAEAGGVGAILRLLAAPPEADRIGHYAGIVLDCWRRRRDLEWATEVMHVTRTGGDAGELIAAWQAERPGGRRIERYTLAELREQYPRLHAPVVDGLLRAGETANIVSTSKAGKSWLAHSLLLSVVTGRDWLDQYACARGRVLLIDNELHRATLAHRITTVGSAMGLRPADYEHDLDIWPLRGNLRSLDLLAVELERIPRDTYRLILCDAWYRMLPGGAGGENDNQAMTAAYNTLDRIAAATGAAIAVIHHSSKGSQTDKRVTDVGSGAGAQSRAADCHLILREHEEPDCVVLASEVRSYPRPEPLPLRWAYPLWVPAQHLDPAALRGHKTAGEERQSDRDREGCRAIRGALEAGPLTRRKLRERVGMGPDRLNRLIAQLADEIETTMIDDIEHLQIGGGL